jgi:hypothetical protein
VWKRQQVPTPEPELALEPLHFEDRSGVEVNAGAAAHRKTDEGRQDPRPRAPRHERTFERGDGMRVFSQDECLRWCADREIDTSGGRPQFRNGKGVFDLALPKIGLKVVVMSGLLSFLRGEAAHAETLVWVTDWGMWSESIDSVGGKLWERILAGYGYPGLDPSKSRGLLFAEPESMDERVILTSIMLFQWDATVVPRDGLHFVRISHDGYISIHAKTDEVASAIAAPVAEWKQVEERTA